MFDKAPELSIDREGKWYADGVHMFRLEVVKLFSEHLERQANGSYKVIWDGKEYPLKIDDVPFVIDELIVDEDKKIKARLTDSRTVDFNPQELYSINGILYMSLFFEKDTLFSRKAQWQTNEYLIEDEGQLVLIINDSHIPIREIS